MVSTALNVADFSRRFDGGGGIRGGSLRLLVRAGVDFFLFGRSSGKTQFAQID